MSLYSSLASLNDSTHLASFLCDLLSTGDLPCWCPKSGEAVCNWIKQIVLEKNVEGAVTITKLVASYTKIENEANLPSYMNVYLTLNTLAEQLGDTYSDTKWTFIDFWQAISDLHMILVKLCPTLFEPHLSKLGEGFLSKICNLSLPLFLRQLQVKCLICLMDACPSNDFKEAFVNEVPNLMMSLSGAGDYDFQVCLVEVIFRLTTPRDRHLNADVWLKDLKEDDKKLFLAISNFDPDCRKFLNCYNASLGKERNVFSFPSLLSLIGNFKLHKPSVDSYEHLWVDFNLGSRTVSILFEHTTTDGEEKPWETIMVYDYEVENAILDQTKGTHTLVLHLKKPPKSLFMVPPSQEVEELLNSTFLMQFKVNEKLPLICSMLFEENFQLTENTYIARQKTSVTKCRIKTNDESEGGQRQQKVSKSITSIVAVSEEMEVLDSENFIPSSNPISDHYSTIGYLQSNKSFSPTTPHTNISYHEKSKKTFVYTSTPRVKSEGKEKISGSNRILEPVLHNQSCHEDQTNQSTMNEIQKCPSIPELIEICSQIGEPFEELNSNVCNNPETEKSMSGESAKKDMSHESAKNDMSHASAKKDMSCDHNSSRSSENREVAEVPSTSKKVNKTTPQESKLKQTSVKTPEAPTPYKKSPGLEGTRIHLFNVQSPGLLDGTPPETNPKKSSPKRIRNKNALKDLNKTKTGNKVNSVRKKKKTSDKPEASIYSDYSDLSADSFDWFNKKSNKRKPASRTYKNSSSFKNKSNSIELSTPCIEKSLERKYPCRSAAQKARRAIKESVVPKSTKFEDSIERHVNSPEILRDTSFKTDIGIHNISKEPCLVVKPNEDENSKDKICPNLVDTIEDSMSYTMNSPKQLELEPTTASSHKGRITYKTQLGTSDHEIICEADQEMSPDDLNDLNKFQLNAKENQDSTDCTDELIEHMIQERQIIPKGFQAKRKTKVIPSPRFRNYFCNTKTFRNQRMKESGRPRRMVRPELPVNECTSTPQRPRRCNLFPKSEAENRDMLRNKPQGILKSILCLVQEQMLSFQRDISELQRRANLISDVLQNCIDD